MGQHWQLVVPHDRIVMDCMWEVGQSIFDGISSEIVEQMAIPVTGWIDETFSDEAPVLEDRE